MNYSGYMKLRILIIGLLLLLAGAYVIGAEDEADIFYKSGLAAAKGNDYETAIRKFNRALQYRPDFPEALFKLGECYEKIDDDTKALANYRRCLKCLQSRTEPSKSDKDLLAGVTRILEKLDIDGNSLRRMKAAQVAELLKLAQECINKRYPRFAARTLGIALQIDPDNKSAQELLAKLGVRTEKTISKNPKAAALVADGMEYFNNGKYNQAIDCFTAAIKADPKCQEAYMSRGLAYYYISQPDKSIADYTEAIKINPKYARAYSNRGTLYSHKQEYDKAIADLTEAIKLNPDIVEARNNRGMAYYNTGEYDKAIKDLNEAVRRDPAVADAYLGLAHSYYKKGRTEEAVRNAEKYLRFKPSGPWADEMRDLIRACNKDSDN